MRLIYNLFGLRKKIYNLFDVEYHVPIAKKEFLQMTSNNGCTVDPSATIIK